jgi:hypothetical protein
MTPPSTSSPSPVPTDAASLTDDALRHELTTCTEDCHVALSSGDYAAAYQSLLRRSPLIQEAAERELILDNGWQKRMMEEAAMQRTLNGSINDIKGKINHLRQAKTQVSKYKSPPKHSGTVTRGFA